MPTTADKLTAADTFAASWSLDLADEIAQHISCYEIEDLARLLRAGRELTDHRHLAELRIGRVLAFLRRGVRE